MPKLGSALVAICLIASLVATSLGDEPDRATPVAAAIAEPTPAPNLVDDAAVAATPPQSPARTVLEWARAVQFSDVSGARALYSREVLRSVPQTALDAALREIGDLLGRPRVVATNRRGERATVRVMLESFGASGGEPARIQPATLRLVRERGRWRLDDASLLLMTARDLQKLRRRGVAEAATRPAP